MENKSTVPEDVSSLLGNLGDSPSQKGKELAGSLRRENDSLDDFEHLEHDGSPVKEIVGSIKQDGKDVLNDILSGKTPPRASGETVLQTINTEAVSVADTVGKKVDEFSIKPDSEEKKKKYESLIDTNIGEMAKTASDVFEYGDFSGNIDTKQPIDKIDDILGDLSYVPAVPPHAEPQTNPIKETSDLFDNFKTATQTFMDTERDELLVEPPKIPTISDFADRFSDSEPETDEFKQPEEFKNPKFDDFNIKTESSKPETFKDVIEDPAPVVPTRDYFENAEPSPAFELHKAEPEPVKSARAEPENITKITVIEPEPVIEKPLPTEPKTKEAKLQQKQMEAERMFCKMGLDLRRVTGSPWFVRGSIIHNDISVPYLADYLKEMSANFFARCASHSSPLVRACCQYDEGDPINDFRPKAALNVLPTDENAWFNPERLNPKVESLIYWRDPKKSGAVFGGTLVVLLSMAYFSLISVAAYLSLLALTFTISFRIYKNVLQAIQKTSDGHPFKDLLEADVTLPQDKVKEFSEIAVTHINAAVSELRKLFLVEDLVDSIKFGVFLWCMTYVGGWFNGMTIVIMTFVALFSVPKVYENNKAQIDANYDIVRTKLADITSKVKAAVPIGKKSEEKKEQ